MRLHQLEFVRLYAEAEGLGHSHDALWRDILSFPVLWGVLINVADPYCEADGADGISERQAYFSVPAAAYG